MTKMFLLYKYDKDVSEKCVKNVAVWPILSLKED